MNLYYLYTGEGMGSVILSLYQTRRPPLKVIGISYYIGRILKGDAPGSCFNTEW